MKVLLFLAAIAVAIGVSSTAEAKAHCRVVGEPGHMHMDCSNEERIAQTPSGRPDASFRGVAATDLSAKLAAHCMDKGWLVVANTPTEVKCSHDINGMKGFLAQLMVGNAYSTPPLAMIDFNLVQLGSDVRVQGHMWVETQMAGGQIRTQEVNDTDDFNMVERVLIDLGGEPPLPPR